MITPRIKVSMLDETTNDNSVIAAESPAVYVIGFTSQAFGTDTGVADENYYTPQYFDNLEDFQAMFGTEPVAYTTDMPYFVDSSAQYFLASAYDKFSSNYVVKAGEEDRGYVYAKKLLQAGIPVIYEALPAAVELDASGNSVQVYDALNIYKYLAEKPIGQYKFTLLDTQPANWGILDFDTQDMYYLKTSDYTYELARKTAPAFSSNTFYYRTRVDDAIQYVKLTSEPIDWFYNYSNYYVQDATGTYYAVVADNPVFKTNTYYTYNEVSGKLVEKFSPFNVNEGSLININEYNLQFITAGGLPVLECLIGGENQIANMMMATAYRRGDCLALLDHTNYAVRPFIGEDGFVKVNPSASSNYINNLGTSLTEAYASHAAIYSPWGFYGTEQAMPGSFGYLIKYAQNLSNNASWLAIAGVNRGVLDTFVPNTSKILTNNIADIFANCNMPINAITNIHGYGQTIYGNNTLYSPYGTLKASQKINQIILVSQVMKEARTAAFRYLFEQNSDSLFYKYKNELTPLLDQMQTGGAISGYKVLKDLEKSTKVKLAVIIRLYTIYAVEAIDIVVSLNDSDVVVSTGEEE